MKKLLPFIILAFTFFICFTSAQRCSAQTEPSETLEQQLIREQINNQRAQSLYYQKQIADKSFWDSAGAGLTAAIGSVCGACLGILGVYLSSKRLWDLEHKKMLQNEKEKIFADKKLAAAELSKKVSAQVIEILWLTWKAKYHPETLTDEDIDVYNKEMKSLQKEETSAHAALATLSLDLHLKVEETVYMVSAFDFDMSFVITEFKKAKGSQSRRDFAEKIGEYYSDAYLLYVKLPYMLGTLLQTESEIKDRNQTPIIKFVFSKRAEKLIGRNIDYPQKSEAT